MLAATILLLKFRDFGTISIPTYRFRWTRMDNILALHTDMGMHVITKLVESNKYNEWMDTRKIWTFTISVFKIPENRKRNCRKNVSRFFSSLLSKNANVFYLLCILKFFCQLHSQTPTKHIIRKFLYCTTHTLHKMVHQMEKKWQFWN